SYCTVLLADENVNLLEKNTANLKDNLKEVTQLFQNGFAEEEDVEQLKLTLSTLNTQLDYAKNLQKLTRSLLKLTLGYPEDQALLLTDQLEALAITQMEPLTNDSPDLSNNIDIKIAENNRASEKLLLRLERSKALPTLRAFVDGNYTGNSDSFTFLENSQKWFGSSLLGVNLSIPLFSSFGRTAASQKAKIALEQAENTLTLTQEQTLLQYLQARNDFDLAVKNYSTRKTNLDLATRIEQKNQIKYMEGMASSFELRQAQTQLYTAQSEYLNAMKEVIVKKTQLQTILNTPN
ncbi:MAG: TolC family protein, partial [Flavobacteriaceae bacterium]